MAYRYRWLNDALKDMSLEIGYVFSEFGLAVAQKTEAKIRERVELLCHFPSMGVVFDGILYYGNEVRVLHIKQISIVYSVQGDLITLIALWNNRQDINRLQNIIGSR